ncbi:MAG TPA: carbon-nitrogen hydrolase family protein [Firmicutes bacterium]|nr:carbon-nitrogen hydrolase family protein [Bacillota bacterium]
MSSQFRIAAVQAAQTADPAANLDRARAYIRRAAEEGADLVLFPECWIQGYRMPLLVPGKTMEEQYAMPSSGLCWEQVRQSPAYREWANAAVTPDGPALRAVREEAAERQIGVVMTAFAKGKDRPRNSAFLIGRRGDILLRYDKVHTCAFSLECLLEGGTEFRVADFDGVRLGILICYDREYPESARVLMKKGAEILLVPNACGGMPPRVNALQTRAYENMTGVVMANFAGENQGNSCAFQPIPWDGEGRAREMALFVADEESEGLYLAEYDLRELREYRQSEMMGDAFRHPEAYRCLLETEVRPPFLREKWIAD